MDYINAEKILPKRLLEEIQHYVNGQFIYIPTVEQTKVSWGVKSGYRKELDERNAIIYDFYQSGMEIMEIANQFYLSSKSVYRIISDMKKKLYKHT